MTRAGRTARDSTASCHREAGMTLVEVLIAACVLMLAFLLAMGAILGMSEANEISEEQAMAVSTASSVVEELRSMSFEKAMAYRPPEAEGEPPGTGISVICFDGQGEAHPLPLDPSGLEEPLPNPVEVQVTVFWRDKVGRPYSSRLSAFLRR